MQDVDARHKDYEKYAKKWKRVRDVASGQDAVHEAGELYLPKLRDQDRAEYLAYVKRAGLYNATWRTMSGLLGMMFRKPPQVDMPPVVVDYASDIDMAGTSLDAFSRKITMEILGPGSVGVMVDHPKVGNVSGMSVEAAESQGLRPMMKCYKRETIINWEYARVRNYWVLSKVVLEESVDEPDGEFKRRTTKQWRVLDLDDSNLYRQRLFRKSSDKGTDFTLIDEFYPLMGGSPMEFVPFYIVGVDGVDSDIDEPPLIDLVDLNLAHYRTNADYEHGCHFTGLPTLFLSGFVNEDGSTPTFYIGSQSAIVSPHPDAKGQYIEFTGAGLSALRENLDRKELQMAIIGARMLFAEKKGVEAAETAAIHRAGENSVLASIAMAISEGLEKALSVLAEWAGTPYDIVYQLNRDFNPAMIGAADVTAYMKAVQAGLMSEQSFYELLQRTDVVDSELTWEDEQERIGQQEPPAPAMPANDEGGMAA